jgi:hypothetical protein
MTFPVNMYWTAERFINDCIMTNILLVNSVRIQIPIYSIVLNLLPKLLCNIKMRVVVALITDR